MVNMVRGVTTLSMCAMWALLSGIPVAAQGHNSSSSWLDDPAVPHSSLGSVAAKPLTSYPAGGLWRGFCSEPLFFSHPCYRSDCTDDGDCSSDLSGSCRACRSGGGASCGNFPGRICHSCQVGCSSTRWTPITDPQFGRVGLGSRRSTVLPGGRILDGLTGVHRGPSRLSAADLVLLTAPPTAQMVEGIPTWSVAGEASAGELGPFSPWSTADEGSSEKWGRDSLGPTNAEPMLFDPQVQPAAAEELAEPELSEGEGTPAPATPSNPLSRLRDHLQDLGL